MWDICIGFTVRFGEFSKSRSSFIQYGGNNTPCHDVCMYVKQLGTYSYSPVAFYSCTLVHRYYTCWCNSYFVLVIIVFVEKLLCVVVTVVVYNAVTTEYREFQSILLNCDLLLA